MFLPRFRSVLPDFLLFLFLLQIGEKDDGDNDDCGSKKLRGGKRLLQKQEGQESGDRSGSVAYRRSDGKFDIAETDIAEKHGADIKKGYRKID